MVNGSMWVVDLTQFGISFRAFACLFLLKDYETLPRQKRESLITTLGLFYIFQAILMKF